MIKTPRICEQDCASDTDVNTSCSGPYVEDKNTPEDPLDGLGDVPPWALGLGSGTKERRIQSLAVCAVSRETKFPGPYIATSSTPWKLKAA